METDLRSSTPVDVPRAPVVWFMALVAALGTATIYPLQPAVAVRPGSNCFAASVTP